MNSILILAYYVCYAKRMPIKEKLIKKIFIKIVDGLSQIGNFLGEVTGFYSTFPKNPVTSQWDSNESYYWEMHSMAKKGGVVSTFIWVSLRILHGQDYSTELWNSSSTNTCFFYKEPSSRPSSKSSLFLDLYLSHSSTKSSLRIP